MTVEAAPPVRAGGVALSEVHAALSLFAEAIAGHPVSIETTDDPVDCWPWRPSHPKPDPVVVPPFVDDFGSRTLNRTAFRSVVLHQVLAADERGAELGPTVSAAVERYGAQLFWRVYTLVEDLRLDWVTRHRFPGAVPGLDRLLVAARQHERKRTGSDSGADPLAIWLAALRMRSLGAPDETVTDDTADPDRSVWKAILEATRVVEGPNADRTHSCTTAARICEILSEWLAGGGSTPAFDADEDDRRDEPAVPGDDDAGISMDRGGTPTHVDPIESLVGGQPANEPQDQIADFLKKKRDAMSAGLLLDGGPKGFGAQPNRTYVYDEWDYTRSEHRLAWCRLVEERLSGQDHDFIGDVRRRHVSLRGRIRRSFGQVRPSDVVRVYRRDDGDELDLDAAIEARVDARSGAPADDRVHVRREKVRRDVATGFLVDLSASTSAPAIPPEPSPPHPADPLDDLISYGPMWDDAPIAEPVRRVIDVAKDAVALMGDALQELGDQHAIYGFSGTGRHQVDFKVAKDFGDRVTPVSWAALAAMKPLHYTRMGPAIRHATTKLLGQTARTKLLIVISDGYPQDTDYGDERTDKEYGIHDTARALADAAEAEIDTFCVTIDPAGHDYLRRMCPDHRYLVIDDVEALPEELAKLYLALSSQ